MLRIVVFLVSRGLDEDLAAAVVRVQMLPQVFLKVAAGTCVVGDRSRGGLTGSRLAGAIGRVPVEAVA